jgi:hypothetical protein
VSLATATISEMVRPSEGKGNTRGKKTRKKVPPLIIVYLTRITHGRRAVLLESTQNNKNVE